jgi:WD40 repeat protein/uncharacterized caspase-like protein
MRLWALLGAIAVQAAVAFSGALAAAEDRYPVEIVAQLGHSESVDSVAFSPDKKTALSGSVDKTLRLWDVATGQLLRTFEGHSDWINVVVFSPDGRRVLSGSRDKTLKLWDTATGHLLRTFEGHSNSVLSAAFSPDGRRILSGGDQTLRLWDAATGKLLRTLFFSSSSPWSPVTFSPDGRRVSWGREVWDAVAFSPFPILRIGDPYKMVDSVAFSPDGSKLLFGSRHGALELWNALTGKLIRTFEEGGRVEAVTFSLDSRRLLSGGDKDIKLWDTATGKVLHTFEASRVLSVAFSPDGRGVLSASRDKTFKLWNAATGELLHTSTFSGHSEGVNATAFSPNGDKIASGSNDQTLKTWDAATGRLLRTLEGGGGYESSVAFSPDGRKILAANSDGTLKLWDADTGELSRNFEGDLPWLNSVALSPDGKKVLSGSGRPDVADGALKLWNAVTGKLLRTFEGAGDVQSVTFSSNGRKVLSGRADGRVDMWSALTGKLLGTFEGTGWQESVSFTPDGDRVLSGDSDGMIRLWNTATQKLIRTFEGHLATFSPDGGKVISADDRTLKLWDVDTGDLLRSLKGHSGIVRAVVYSRDGRRLLSASADGTVRLWSLDTGSELARMLASPKGEWLTMAAPGFFFSSRRDSDLLAIVRGTEATTSGQIHQSLYNPDLVREALAGDPDGEVRLAAEVINLDKVLDAGPPPAVAIISHVPGRRTGSDLVTLAARITDQGKGIGRIEWRVNGVTVGVTSPRAGHGRAYDVSQELALDLGENRVEVIAHEGRNLLASRSAQVTITYDGPTDTAKPKLYVLAIGVNKYVDRGGDGGRFLPLAGSVPDARAFSAEMEKAGAGLYEEVRVTLALDEDATRSKLDEAVNKIAGVISPRDTFVLYAAAHGYSLSGNYYMIPQDFQGGANPTALKTRAIGQERIQEWLASRIKAKRAVILLDTCESGALTGGYARSRTEGTVSEAAVGRLHEATGRPVITAAAPGKSAYENYKGHGVFTYALIEALHQGDTNNNGKIEVSELAAHVERRVPELFAELKQNGFVVKGLAATRGGDGDAQTAHFGSTGEDFAVVRLLL